MRKLHVTTCLLASLLPSCGGGGYRGRGDSAFSAGRYSNAYSCYDRELGRYGRNTENDPEVERLRAKAAGAWIHAEVTAALALATGGQLEPAYGRLNTLLERARKVHAEAPVIVEAETALGQVVDQMWPQVAADMKPGSYSRAIRVAEGLVLPFSDASPYRRKVADALGVAAAYHLAQAAAAHDEPAVEYFHLRMAQRFGAPASPRLAQLTSNMEGSRGVNWSLDVGGVPCPPAVSGAQSTFRSGGAGGAAKAHLNVTSCTVVEKRSDERRGMPWSENVQHTETVFADVCSDTTVYANTTCSASSVPARQGTVNEVCHANTNTARSCSSQAVGTRVVNETVQHTEMVVVHHVTYSVQVAATGTVTWETGESSSEVGYAGMVDDTAYSPEHVKPKAFEYSSSPAQADASASLAAQLEGLAFRVKYYRGEASAANGGGRNDDQAMAGFVKSAILTRKILPGAMQFFRDKYGMEEYQVRGVLLDDKSVQKIWLPPFSVAALETGGCPGGT